MARPPQWTLAVFHREMENHLFLAKPVSFCFPAASYFSTRQESPACVVPPSQKRTIPRERVRQVRHAPKERIEIPSVQSLPIAAILPQARGPGFFNIQAQSITAASRNEGKRSVFLLRR
jgi:hypothetical protein